MQAFSLISLAILDITVCAWQICLTNSMPNADERLNIMMYNDWTATLVFCKTDPNPYLIMTGWSKVLVVGSWIWVQKKWLTVRKGRIILRALLPISHRHPDTHQDAYGWRLWERPPDAEIGGFYGTKSSNLTRNVSRAVFQLERPNQWRWYWSDPHTTFVSLWDTARLHNNWPKRVIESGAFLAQSVSAVGSWVQLGRQWSLLSQPGLVTPLALLFGRTSWMRNFRLFPLAVYVFCLVKAQFQVSASNGLLPSTCSIKPTVSIHFLHESSQVLRLHKCILIHTPEHLTFQHPPPRCPWLDLSPRKTELPGSPWREYDWSLWKHHYDQRKPTVWGSKPQIKGRSYQRAWTSLTGLDSQTTISSKSLLKTRWSLNTALTFEPTTPGKQLTHLDIATKMLFCI